LFSVREVEQRDIFGGARGPKRQVQPTDLGDVRAEDFYLQIDQDYTKQNNTNRNG
jgi:hypothetical protein